MRAKSFEGMACSIAGALEAISDRWGFLILRDLLLGLTRYDELQASTGMPPNTLSNRLKTLEANGLLERRLYCEHPPRHEYVLTEKGRDWWLVNTALAQWGDKWNASGRGAPPIEMRHRDTGRKLVLALTDPKTGERVRREKLAVRPGPGADDLARWRINRRWERDQAVKE